MHIVGFDHLGERSDDLVVLGGYWLEAYCLAAAYGGGYFGDPPEVPFDRPVQEVVGGVLVLQGVVLGGPAVAKGADKTVLELHQPLLPQPS